MGLVSPIMLMHYNLPTKKTLEDYTWTEIKAIVNAGQIDKFSIGDYKKYTLYNGTKSREFYATILNKDDNILTFITMPITADVDLFTVSYGGTGTEDYQQWNKSELGKIFGTNSGIHIEDEELKTACSLPRVVPYIIFNKDGQEINTGITPNSNCIYLPSMSDYNLTISENDSACAKIYKNNSIFDSKNYSYSSITNGSLPLIDGHTFWTINWANTNQNAGNSKDPTTVYYYATEYSISFGNFSYIRESTTANCYVQPMFQIKKE